MSKKTERERPRRSVPLECLNVLLQARRTFDKEGLEELAGSIKTKGLQTPLFVAIFTRDELKEYLKVINKLYNCAISIRQLKQITVGGQPRWYVLLAGERRLRACRLLAKAGERDHFVDVVVYEHLSPEEAQDIQFLENCHQRVLPEEDAPAIAEFFAWRGNTNRSHFRQTDREIVFAGYRCVAIRVAS
jgi:hypothetical protein